MQTGYTLDSNEQIIRKINRHWIDLVPVYAISGLLVVAIILLGYALGRFRDQLSFVNPALFGLVIVVLIVLAALILVVGLWVYRQNYLLLTTRHLIQVEQRGLFNRSVAQLSLERVQDVSARRIGMMATILDYGNVEVQSAGEEEKFVFRNAPSPQALADECLAVHEKYGSVSAQSEA